MSLSGKLAIVTDISRRLGLTYASELAHSPIEGCSLFTRYAGTSARWRRLG
jgi:hypothetical protein